MASGVAKADIPHPRARATHNCGSWARGLTQRNLVHPGILRVRFSHCHCESHSSDTRRFCTNGISDGERHRLVIIQRLYLLAMGVAKNIALPGQQTGDEGAIVLGQHIVRGREGEGRFRLVRAQHHMRRWRPYAILAQVPGCAYRLLDKAHANRQGLHGRWRYRNGEGQGVTLGNCKATRHQGDCRYDRRVRDGAGQAGPGSAQVVHQFHGEALVAFRAVGIHHCGHPQHHRAGPGWQQQLAGNGAVVAVVQALGGCAVNKAVGPGEVGGGHRAEPQHKVQWLPFPGRGVRRGQGDARGRHRRLNVPHLQGRLARADKVVAAAGCQAHHKDAVILHHAIGNSGYGVGGGALPLRQHQLAAWGGCQVVASALVYALHCDRHSHGCRCRAVGADGEQGIVALVNGDGSLTPADGQEVAGILHRRLAAGHGAQGVARRQRVHGRRQGSGNRAGSLGHAIVQGAHCEAQRALAGWQRQHAAQAGGEGRAGKGVAGFAHHQAKVQRPPGHRLGTDDEHHRLAFGHAGHACLHGDFRHIVVHQGNAQRLGGNWVIVRAGGGEQGYPAIRLVLVVTHHRHGEHQP